MEKKIAFGFEWLSEEGSERIDRATNNARRIIIMRRVSPLHERR